MDKELTREEVNLIRLKNYLYIKKWEVENIEQEQTEFNKGILLGLEIAIDIMEIKNKS